MKTEKELATMSTADFIKEADAAIARHDGTDRCEEPGQPPRPIQKGCKLPAAAAIEALSHAHTADVATQHFTPIMEENMTHATLQAADAPADPSVAYALVKNLIFDQIHKFRGRFGGDIEELEGDANLAFMRGYVQCRSGHRPNGEPLDLPYHVEIRRWVWYTLFDAMRAKLQRQSKVRVKLMGHYDISVPDNRYFDGVAFAEELTDDGQVVLGLVLDTPEDLAEVISRKGGEPRNVRSSVREWLGNKGWGAERINQSFDDIRRALK